MNCQTICNYFIVCSPVQAQAREKFWKLSLTVRIAVAILSGLAGVATFWAAGVGGVAFFGVLVNRLQPIDKSKINPSVTKIRQQRFSALIDKVSLPHTPLSSPRHQPSQINPSLLSSFENRAPPNPLTDPENSEMRSENELKEVHLENEAKEKGPLEKKETLFTMLNTLETKDFVVNRLTECVLKSDQLKNFTGILHVEEMGTLSLTKLLTILCTALDVIDDFKPSCISINLGYSHSLNAQDIDRLRELTCYTHSAKLLILKGLTELDLTKLKFTSEQSEQLINMINELYCPDLQTFKCDDIEEKHFDTIHRLLTTPILTVDALKQIPDDSLCLLACCVKSEKSPPLSDRFKSDLKRRLDEKQTSLQIALEFNDPSVEQLSVEIAQIEKVLLFLAKR